MLRENALTRPTVFEHVDENAVVTLRSVGGTTGKKNTRLMFPQVTANLGQRWCSAYLKIGVAGTALRNQTRFNGIRTLVLTGERAEESANRAKYKTFEPHPSDLRNGKKFQRHIDQWRPVHGMDETEVWSLMAEYGINPHPAYQMGWSRLSCKNCIFGNKDQWASVKKVSQDNFTEVQEYEIKFKKTIHRTKSVDALADAGKPYAGITQELVRQATSKSYDQDIIISNWELPSGAFGNSGGSL